MPLTIFPFPNVEVLFAQILCPIPIGGVIDLSNVVKVFPIELPDPRSISILVHALVPTSIRKIIKVVLLNIWD